MGRIMRPKPRTSNDSAYFYSLVSADTHEMCACARAHALARPRMAAAGASALTSCHSA